MPGFGPKRTKASFYSAMVCLLLTRSGHTGRRVRGPACIPRRPSRFAAWSVLFRPCSSGPRRRFSENYRQRDRRESQGGRSAPADGLLNQTARGKHGITRIGLSIHNSSTRYGVCGIHYDCARFSSRYEGFADYSASFAWLHGTRFCGGSICNTCAPPCNFRIVRSCHLAFYKPNHCYRFNWPHLDHRAPVSANYRKASSAFSDQFRHHGHCHSCAAGKCGWFAIRSAAWSCRNRCNMAARSRGGNLHANL